MLEKGIDGIRGGRSMKLFKAPVMTPRHKRWQEFYNLLALQARHCAGTRDRPLAHAVLASMGGFDIKASLAYFDNHGGYCDCEIVLNMQVSA